MVRRAWHSDRLAASENVDATYDVRVGLGAVAGDKESSGEDGELSWSRYAASDDRHRLLSGWPRQRQRQRQRRSLGRGPSGGGTAIRVPGSPHHVYGLAAGKNALYLSTNHALLAWSGWNGTGFQKTRVVMTRAPYGNFREPAVGPDGLIYVGADTSLPPPTPNYNSSLVSVDPATGSITVVASGMRQPWQPLFLPGHALPLVSDLNQDDLGPNRPADYLLAIKRGGNYGFPACPANPRTCAIYDQPLVRFPAHSSPMGLGYLKGTLYVALYGGLGKGPVVVSMPPEGGKPKPFLSRFPAPVIAVGTFGGNLYAGDQSGVIYRVRP